MCSSSDKKKRRSAKEWCPCKTPAELRLQCWLLGWPLKFSTSGGWALPPSSSLPAPFAHILFYVQVPRSISGENQKDVNLLLSHQDNLCSSHLWQPDFAGLRPSRGHCYSSHSWASELSPANGITNAIISTDSPRSFHSITIRFPILAASKSIWYD